MDYSSARILEIGDHSYFRQIYPETTTLLWTAHRPPRHLHPSEYLDCTPRHLSRTIGDIKRGGYDLVVIYPHARAAWHPRYWLRALVYTPSHPVAALTRCFGIPMLRFVGFKTPLVVVDMHDDFTIHRSNFFLLGRAKNYFKRELPVDAWQTLHGTAHHDLPTRQLRSNKRWQDWLEKLRPISLQIGRIDIGDADKVFAAKTTDVFFAGNVQSNSTLRLNGAAQLRRLADLGVRVDMPSTLLSKSEYQHRMSLAWLAWSPSGRGWDCYRHYEAPQCLAVPVINYPTILRHMPLEDGRHAIYYAPEGNGLAEAVSNALLDRDRLKTIALAGRAHVQANHVDRAFCDRILALALEGA